VELEVNYFLSSLLLKLNKSKYNVLNTILKNLNLSIKSNLFKPDIKL
jgi:hypothetical protein